MISIAWQASVFLSRWRNRMRSVIVAPFVYRNWWRMYLAKICPAATVLELRNGTKYFVRAGTTDLGVINEAVILNPYLAAGHIRLATDATVVDVGANIGDFTIQAAKLCPAGRVYAIEPIGSNCESIRRQIQLNGVTNATVLQAALGDRDGETEIHAAGGHSSMYWGAHSSERVRLTTLQSVMRDNNIQTVDVLKLDCEGAEWDILPAIDALLPQIRQVCLEYHNGKRTVDWLEGWLTQRGFSVRRTTGPWNGLLWAWH